MSNAGRNEANINYSYSNYDVTITIFVTFPHTFSITNYNIDLLGFNNTVNIISFRISNKPVNFFFHKMLYAILAKVPRKNDELEHLFNITLINLLCAITKHND